MARDCWIYAGYKAPSGYGQVYIESRKGPAMAHRLVYEALVGEIPEGLHLDHLCRNRACVNPDHLEPVTRKVNILRGESPFALNSRRTHCVKGHELTSDNIYHRKDRNTRECKACRDTAVKRYLIKKERIVT